MSLDEHDVLGHERMLLCFFPVGIAYLLSPKNASLVVADGRRKGPRPENRSAMYSLSL